MSSCRSCSNCGVSFHFIIHHPFSFYLLELCFFHFILINPNKKDSHVIRIGKRD